MKVDSVLSLSNYQDDLTHETKLNLIMTFSLSKNKQNNFEKLRPGMKAVITEKNEFEHRDQSV